MANNFTVSEERANNIVDMIFDVLDELDIEVWEDTQYLELPEFWCRAVLTSANDNEIKDKLKWLLFG